VWGFSGLRWYNTQLFEPEGSLEPKWLIKNMAKRGPKRQNPNPTNPTVIKRE